MFHVKHEGLGEGATRVGVSLSAEAADRLGAYEQILLERGGPMGLVAPKDLVRVRERHILDSIRAAALVGPEPVSGYDLGSGGGLPGIVLAIARPHLTVTLVEVRRNRAAFLRRAAAELGLTNIEVYPRRAETLRARKDLCFARAFAPLPRAWSTAESLLVPGGRLLYWAGGGFNIAEDMPGGVSNALHPAPGLAGAGVLVELRVP
jgi:16S rRNA (guanine527-N7)-methyltransferase